MQRNSFPLDYLNNTLSLKQYSFSSKDYKENSLQGTDVILFSEFLSANMFSAPFELHVYEKNTAVQKKTPFRFQSWGLRLCCMVSLSIASHRLRFLVHCHICFSVSMTYSLSLE